MKLSLKSGSFLVLLFNYAVLGVKLNSSYLELPPVPPFTGNLAPNDRLEKAIHLDEKIIRGPETIEISKDGFIYTGLANGQVIRVSLDGTITKLTTIGSVANESICEAGPTPSIAECGRPLGVRLRDNTLYIADAFFGLVKLDIQTGQKTFLLRNNDARFGDRPLKFTNDLDVDGDMIYFVDTSYLRNVNEFLEEYIEAQPHGRLFSFNQKTNELKLLLENLYFPNGIQLSPTKDAVLVNENTKCRIIRYYLSGANQGQVDVFANLPGFSDSIRMTDKQTLLVPFGVSRHPIYYSLLDLLGKWPSFRNFVAWLVDPNMLFTLSPKYGLLVEYDFNGQILRSWHDPTGKVIESTASAALYNGKLYIGSLYIDYIGVVDY